MRELTAEIARWAARLRYDDIDAGVRAKARLLLLDHLGCVLAGSVTAPAAAARSAMGATTSGFQPSESCGTAVSSFLNGLAAHSIEMDDTHLASSLHPGACVLPAALSIAEMNNLHGEQLLTAMVTGYEGACRIGMAAHPKRLYDRGFHPTGVCGVFGAALAVAKLLELDKDKTLNALGIASSQASGVMEFLNDGSWTKPLHAGWAAESGLTAAMLAASGYQGAKKALEGRYGFLQSFASQTRVDNLDLSGQAIADVALKPHACCRYSQGAIDLAIEISANEGPPQEKIERIDVETVSAAIPIVAEPRVRKVRPASVVDAQFSLPYSIAVAFVTGRAFLAQYSNKALTDERVLALADKVHCHPSTEFDQVYPAIWPTRLTFTLTDGTLLQKRTDHARGDSNNALSRDEVKDKFRSLVRDHVRPAAVDEMIAAVLGFDSNPVREITRFLTRHDV